MASSSPSCPQAADAICLRPPLCTVNGSHLFHDTVAGGADMKEGLCSALIYGGRHLVGGIGNASCFLPPALCAVTDVIQALSFVLTVAQNMKPAKGDCYKELSPTMTHEGNVVMSFSFDSCQLEEEELQGRGSQQAQGILTLMEPDTNPEPQDRYHGIYFAMLLAGVGFLLPYNSFITDVDYLHHKFPGTSIVFDMSLTYILVALAAVVLNNATVELLTTHMRITAGYIFALGPLIFIGICDVWLELFTFKQSYAINLFAVGIVAFGCTVQQSSFYGYTGMLPKRYTQGVMTGESTAGVIISLSRIFTKLLLPNEKESTIIFFLISISLELMCFVLHLLVRRTRFVQYYTNKALLKMSCRNISEPSFHYKVHHSTYGEDENRCSATENNVELHSDITTRGTYIRFDVPEHKVKSRWPNFRDMMFHRYLVLRVIWAHMLSISVTYLITLCLFPGLESEIRNCTMGEWLPILIMAIFNLSDFVGKILAAVPYEWRGINLLICSSMRVVFIPLFIMCVYPSGKPTFSHPAWACIFSLLMGITNGYFGSVPMILASGLVVPEQRELAGNTMTVSYMTGLTLGSAVAYFAYSLASKSQNICFHPEIYNSSLPPNI